MLDVHLYIVALGIGGALYVLFRTRAAFAHLEFKVAVAVEICAVGQLVGLVECPPGLVCPGAVAGSFGILDCVVYRVFKVGSAQAFEVVVVALGYFGHQCRRKRRDSSQGKQVDFLHAGLCLVNDWKLECKNTCFYE